VFIDKCNLLENKLIYITATWSLAVTEKHGFGYLGKCCWKNSLYLRCEM